MITKEEVKMAGKSAKIGLTEDEILKFTKEINDMLLFIDMIDEVQLDPSVEEFDGFSYLTPNFREDIPNKNCLAAADLFDKNRVDSDGYVFIKRQI